MDSKPLIVDKQTEELIKNGALAFVDSIKFLPYQTGDKVFLQEEFETKASNGVNKQYETMYKDIDRGYKGIWQPKENMTYEQSRYKFTIDVEIVRVQDIELYQILDILNMNDLDWMATDYKDKVEDFIDHCEYKNIDYDNNEYITLYTLKKDKQ